MTKYCAKIEAGNKFLDLKDALEKDVKDYVLNGFTEFEMFGRTKGRALSILMDKWAEGKPTETTILRVYADGRVKEYTRGGGLLGEPVVNRRNIARLLHRYQEAYKAYKAM